MVKKHLPKPKKDTKSNKISEKATANASQVGTTDHLKPSFRFTYADENRWHLSEWKADEIKELIRDLKKIENHTWLQTKEQRSKKRGDSVGCGFKIIQNHPHLPNAVSEDVTISEMRIGQKKRIFGFRAESHYYIIWFDRDHSVCPE